MHYSTRPEPFGRVILEAMACGVPVIAAAEGGPLEIVGEDERSRQEAGWLAEPRNPAALARVLREGLSLSRGELRSIGARGRERAEDQFSGRAFAARLALLLKVTARGGG